ncbi:MAG: hypothetical protein QF876_12935 [Desulfobacterales bacterium]|jgi:PP-loop superfamily ATP-utilizing enzyme|nr:hypothetical protein [Desulfobacterales bacterium]MDP6806323.1 hypothetical protein [Desulfobacterales bacterium]
MTELIYKKFRKIGFTYIAIDLLGYRTWKFKRGVVNIGLQLM